MEQLEIHSKSYLVRWVDVKAGSTISWSIQPHKKSIHFGIFKHPGAGIAPTPKLPLSTFEGPPTPALQPADAAQDLPQQRNASSAAVDKLKSIGLKEISWYGACEANRVTTGRWDVPEGEAGMYGLVFDNTFSKQLSKSVTFVLLTFPTSSFPPINHHIQGRPTINGRNSDHQSRRIKMGRQRGSSDSIPQSGTSTLLSPERRNESQQQGTDQPKGANDSNFFTGILQKRRRKRHQGFARRFFSLDFSTATLSYYHSRHTSAIRGAIPLSLAAIGANGKSRDISIDSGAEIWHLRATNARDFEAWKNALELARTSHSPASPANGVKTDASGRTFVSTPVNPEEEREWEKVENLVNRVQDSRKMARLLAKDTDPRYLPLELPRPLFERKSTASSASDSPSEQSLTQCVSGGSQRRPFWRRKASGEKSLANPTSSRSVSAQPANTPSPSMPSTPDEAATPGPSNKTLASHAEESLHEHSLAILQNLDTIASEFAILIQQSKQRRHPARPMLVSTPSRYSLDSLGESQEFYDAESGESSQLLAIQQETDDEEEKADQPEVSDEDSASEAEGSGSEDIEEAPQAATPSAYPSKPKSLTPLPAKWVKRRATVTAPTVAVPSLISFLRKNVGKDLSTISMPASSNEPLSFLQRASEQMEYSQLLDSAAKTDDKSSSTLRLLYITAFAISTFSYARIKERAIRKPFNPMLGETFELVREDRGFRFVSEKVLHRPVRMACQAESEKWSFAQAPAPTQKFWGKSAELVTEGRVRVILHTTGDRFVWTPATSFLRNIIAGEKYVEPVGTMTVTNESTGEHAIVTFKSKGMFSGRSEDVVVEAKDRFGDTLPLGLVGKWTHSLSLTENGDPPATANAKSSNDQQQPIWQIDDAPPEASKRYGFTTFAASLNEITPLEKDRLPPTDSRLRPDQRYLENNDFEGAERVKARLEEAQRRRRREMGEGEGGWKPRWFEKVEGMEEGGAGAGGGEVWVLREGPEGYWERRGRGAWGGGERVFDE